MYLLNQNTQSQFNVVYLKVNDDYHYEDGGDGDYDDDYYDDDDNNNNNNNTRFTTRTILGKEYRSRSSSLGNFLHSPLTSSLLQPDTTLQQITVLFPTHKTQLLFNRIYF